MTMTRRLDATPRNALVALVGLAAVGLTVAVIWSRLHSADVEALNVGDGVTGFVARAKSDPSKWTFHGHLNVVGEECLGVGPDEGDGATIVVWPKDVRPEVASGTVHFADEDVRFGEQIVGRVVDSGPSLTMVAVDGSIPGSCRDLAYIELADVAAFDRGQ